MISDRRCIPWELLAVFLDHCRCMRRSVQWVHSPAPLAHPLDDGAAVLLERDIDAAAKALGN